MEITGSTLLNGFQCCLRKAWTLISCFFHCLFLLKEKYSGHLTSSWLVLLEDSLGISQGVHIEPTINKARPTLLNDADFPKHSLTACPFFPHNL